MVHKKHERHETKLDVAPVQQFTHWISIYSMKFFVCFVYFVDNYFFNRYA